MGYWTPYVYHNGLVCPTRCWKCRLCISYSNHIAAPVAAPLPTPPPHPRRSPLANHSHNSLPRELTSVSYSLSFAQPVKEMLAKINAKIALRNETPEENRTCVFYNTY
jgi:hypothetical protein